MCARRVLVALATAQFASGVALANGIPPNYLPIDPGMHWSYSSGTSERTSTIIGNQKVRGVETVVREQETTTDLFRNFWTVDTGGDVFLHGAQNLIYGYYAEYVPPILWYDAPLFVGKTWETAIDLCGESEQPPCGQGTTFRCEIVGEKQLTVPAGTFDVYHFEAVQDFPDPRGIMPDVQFDVLGRAHGSSAHGEVPDSEQWVSDGTGTIQFRDFYTDLLYHLDSTGTVTPTGNASWARIKSVFRGKTAR